MYAVRFGDAILVAVPDTDGGADTTRHILFDFGNVLAGEGGQDAVFEPVIDDVRSVLAGRPLDLYVMTHEHLDHVQGLVYAASVLGKRIEVRQAWLTASAAPDYYDRFPEARRRRLAALAAYRSVRLQMRGARALSPFTRLLLANNDARSTQASVRFLREELTDPAAVRYVHRQADLSDHQPSSQATISIWAPEEDTSDYYGRFAATAGSVPPGSDEAAAEAPEADDDDGQALPIPPGGVDAGAFYHLIDSRRTNGMTTLLRIDRASNNTSVVLCLEWSGWRLLFSGDAEVRSWRTMNRQGVIQPVHFLKVSHHGSHTGMPPAEILDRLLPVEPHDDRPRFSAVSTFPGAFDGVPDAATLATLAQRTELRSTTELAETGSYLDFTFAARPASGASDV
jgi:hypothetical protein